ncbi:MAG TPA: protein-L-isoaspartate(D-aspartate) O-methyltransferase [Gammaproteobacteria bacterium]|nr:protein-L-isoaspartate(D-aspartate) O-methyltransferase [Gammaproteobacteria bacterium]
MNFEQARVNMIAQQIRPWNVLDEAVLAACSQVPREAFVPQQYRSLAFADMQLPLDHGQFMMSPRLEARLLQALELRTSDKVLEIGTGSGFMAALLAALSKAVCSVEIFQDLVHTAEQKLYQQGVQNVEVICADGAEGWSDSAPYDAILVTASVVEIPLRLKEQLRTGGRLVAVVGEDPIMEARCLQRLDHSNWSETRLLDTSIAPLLDAAAAVVQRPSFIF